MKEAQYISSGGGGWRGVGVKVSPVLSMACSFLEELDGLSDDGFMSPLF